MKKLIKVIADMKKVIPIILILALAAFIVRYQYRYRKPLYTIEYVESGKILHLKDRRMLTLGEADNLAEDLGGRVVLWSEVFWVDESGTIRER